MSHAAYNNTDSGEAHVSVYRKKQKPPLCQVTVFCVKLWSSRADRKVLPLWGLYQIEGAKSIASRKTTTSTEVKNRWNAKTYKRYTVNLRKDEDADLIDYIEKHKDSQSITDYFRAGIEQFKNGGWKAPKNMTYLQSI